MFNPSLAYFLYSIERKWSCSVVSNSFWPHGLEPTRFLCPWDFPGKSTGVGCHFLLQAIFPTQGSNLGLPHCRQSFYHLSHQGSWLCSIENVLIHSSTCSSPVVPAPLNWRDCLSSTVYSCLLCHNLIDHRCVGLFLGFLPCSIGPYDFCPRITLFWLL